MEIFPLATVQVYIFLMILLGLMISFSYSHIHSSLIKNNDKLKEKKETLEKAALELKSEIETRIKSEEFAINNEKNFRNIFDKNTDPIIITRKDGFIVDYNEAFKKIADLTDSEILALKPQHFFKGDNKNIFNEIFNNPNEIPQKFEFTYEFKDGNLRSYDVSISKIKYYEQESFMFMIHDFTEKINREKETYMAIISAEEKERANFSRELHDGLDPLLSTLKIYLEVYFSNPSDNEIKERIDSILSESIKSVKEISNNLSPHTLENLGLKKALESFIGKIKFSKKIKISFYSNLEIRLKPEVEISIYRFITELINNTLKHAQASMIDVNLEIINDILTINYSDNGVGFDLSSDKLHSKGIGLFNLKSRIEKIGGTTEYVTSPGNGFKAIAKLNI